MIYRSALRYWAAALASALLLAPLGQAGEKEGAVLLPEVGALAPATAGLAPPADVLRIVSFNVHYARDLSALAESFRTSAALRKADIILLQEIESYPAEGASRARKLAEALQLNYVYAPARRTQHRGTHGLAILSRHPLSDIEILPLPNFDLRERTRRRIGLGVTAEVEGRRVRVYNVHLDTRINFPDRQAQLQPVLEAASRRGVAAVVVGGDFNTNSMRWAWGGRLPIFRSNQAGQLDDFMAEQGFKTPLAEGGSTFRKGLWRGRLDSIFVRGLEPRGAEVEREVEVSDHFPVWLDLAWPPADSRAGAKSVK